MAGINLDLVTDTRDIKAGFKDVESALESVADSLDEVAKEGEDATEKLERSFSDLAKETKKDARAMGQDVKDSYKTMARDSGEATTQMKEDGFSNAKEVAASFDGSAESIVDGFQGAAAEMFSGFGPAGAAAGLAAAAGLGLITAELQKQKEEAEEAAQAAWDMAQEMVDAGVYAVTEGQKVELLKNWLGDPEAQKEVEGILDELGITASDFGAAMVGLGDKREEVEGRINAHYDQQRSKLGDMFLSYEAIQAERKRITDAENDALGLIEDQQSIMGEAVKLAKELTDTFSDVGIEIEKDKDEVAKLRDETKLLNLQDATPKFDMSPAFKELSRFQQELNKLKVPSLNVRITRTVI
jgi:hypothetical protein